MELLELVQLDWLADRYPHQLSGGQRQRIALARALAVEPKRAAAGRAVRRARCARCGRSCAAGCARLHDEIHVTSVFVTHDQEEALEVADRIVVMNQGRIEQVGTPDDVYDHPATPFVHGFIGESIVLPVDVQDGVIWLGGTPLNIAAECGVSGPSKLFVRRHDMQISPPGWGGLEGTVRGADLRSDPARRRRIVRRPGRNYHRDRCAA